MPERPPGNGKPPRGDGRVTLRAIRKGERNMKHEFKTLQNALEAGYTLPNKKADTDISGSLYHGYDYQNENGEKTVTVYFSEEKNRGNGTGCYRPMFPPIASEQPAEPETEIDKSLEVKEC